MPGVVQFQGWRLKLRELYFGGSATARRFRYGIILFDLLTLIFVIGTSFMPREPWVGVVDVVIGLILTVEYAAHLAAHRAPETPVIARTEVAHAVPAWRCCRGRLPVARSCRRGKMTSPSASSFRPGSGPRSADCLTSNFPPPAA